MQKSNVLVTSLARGDECKALFFVVLLPYVSSYQGWSTSDDENEDKGQG